MESHISRKTSEMWGTRPWLRNQGASKGARCKQTDQPTEAGTEPGCFLAVPRMPSRVRIGAVSMVVTSAITTSMVKNVGVKAPTV